jgi:DNA modification methylase
MKIENWPLDKIIPYQYNPRNNDDAVEMTAKSIQEYGWRQPIVVDEHGIIICGHTRLKAAEWLGLDTAPVHVAEGLTDDQVRGYRIMDNRSGELATWDDDLLMQEIEGLSNSGFDLELTGFSMDDLGMTDEEIPGGNTDPDEIPEEPADPVTRPGDMWTLGEHRILCGDSTKAEDVARAMGGEKADMMFTDPPYGMGLDTDYTHMAEKKIKSKTYSTVIGDNKDFDASFIFNFFPDCVEVFLWGADWYYPTLPPGGSWIVWDKRSESSDGLTGNHFEMLWSLRRHKRYIIRHLWAGFTARNKDTRRCHPTEKPVEVLVEIISNYSKSGDSVIDLFLGSGSTLIAAEKTGRKCRAIEISPAYVDVSVQRWADFTGQDPVRHDGVKWSELTK